LTASPNIVTRVPTIAGCGAGFIGGYLVGVSRYDIGVSVSGDLCVGRAGNLLEIVTVLREDDTEVVIHAMPMRRTYEPLVRRMGEPHG
jgi:hypothetical protein